MVITYFWLMIYQSITRRFIAIIKLESATKAIKLLAIMKLFNEIVYDKK
jgi:hypothetical protein